eukprot:TRINITY_DN488_c0_g1_i1.p2 TRINITY_DN488_c0_g1~~TRINITY_DN488_c0_g1_i1.p2  ORF type:complete len:168 (-),score=50.60 TRINITY_DN488_c0_g1_i1:132-569(-)
MCDVSAPELAEAYQEIRKDSNETNWILLGYEGNTKIVLKGKGTGGVSEMAQQLGEDEAAYGYLRIITGDNESRRTKFVFLSWCGPNVGALKRAKMSVHKADIKKILKEYAVEVHATSAEELDEESINQKVRKAGGADYSGNKSRE